MSHAHAVEVENGAWLDAVHELAFALLFLVVAAIPLRRGDRWAWWCSWLIILPLARYAAVFGPHDHLNLIAAISAIAIVALALLALRPTAAHESPAAHPTTYRMGDEPEARQRPRGADSS